MSERAFDGTPDPEDSFQDTYQQVRWSGALFPGRGQETRQGGVDVDREGPGFGSGPYPFDGS